MPGQCCVFQIFDDGGAYDKRYDEVIRPAITSAGLEPYRVDRDAGAEIPIDTLHDEICRSLVCLADITPDNPNVWYELGFAVASDQPIVMICKKGRTLPFDTHHRHTIFYEQESPGDFEQLKNEITNRLKTALEKRARVQRVVSGSPIKATGGLQTHEIAALALTIANRDSIDDSASMHQIRNGMREAGYSDVATSLALLSLTRKSYVKSESLEDYEKGGRFYAYWLMPEGEEWLLANQDKLELRVRGGADIDDVPF